ncbi:hypothetical protein SCHPADRAFT_892030 [Schizopora paradoxa]|uniref:F-box domain-containing protein n=1 Tax=Schizopora paradoxa TaxID=27342 RepID=A0A0H2RGX6_9AGAM|nr:hypothetical protein SCHPADRAFT_892030 [Schizopora paradoxa]
MAEENIVRQSRIENAEETARTEGLLEASRSKGREIQNSLANSSKVCNTRILTDFSIKTSESPRGTSEYSSDISEGSPAASLSLLPSELLSLIFHFATDSFDPKKDPSIDVGNCSPWSTDLRTRKAIIRACKLWRDIAVASLYDRIYLHHVGQLCALVRTLEQNIASNEGRGYAAWIQHIHGDFYVPKSWEAVYTRRFTDLLAFCSSIRSLTWKIKWHGFADQPVSHSIAHLLSSSQSKFRSAISSLRELTFALDDVPSVSETPLSDLPSTITFDNLEHLTCEVKKHSAMRQFEFISEAFILPKIKHLTINHQESWVRPELIDLTFIFKMLQSFGVKLTSFSLSQASTGDLSARRSIANVLNLTPNLESLQLTCIYFEAIETPLASPLSHLTSVELFSEPTLLNSSLDGALEPFLEMFEDRESFPHLRSLKIYDYRFPNLPVNGVLAYSSSRSSAIFFFSWRSRYHQKGIVLECIGDNPKLAADQARWNAWTARVKENDELGYCHDDSEDYHPTSDDSSDSECNSSLYSTSDVEEDGSPSIIGSTEALQIFERTVEVRFIFCMEIKSKYANHLR